jgi:hypothetical protein
VPVLLVAPIAGRATVRVPIRAILTLGLVLVAVGLVLMSGLSGGSGFTHLLPGFIVGGVGVGVVNPALASTAVGVVPHNRSGINNTFRQVGIATGIAAYGAIFQHEVSSRTLSTLTKSGQLGAIVRGTHGQLQSTFASGSTGRLAQSLPPTLRNALVGAFHTAFAGALNEILLIAAALALAGAIGGLVLVRRSDFIAADTSHAAAPAAVA